MNTERELYRIHQLPVLQNRVFNTYQEAVECQTGDMVLVQNLDTGLIYNQAFQPEIIEYNSAYDNEQSHSRVFQDHLEDVMRIVKQHFSGQSIIEVGCGKGYFLEQLQNQGFNIRGCDPTYTGSNPSIIKEYFNTELGLQADGIILRHVLEHIPNPVAFLRTIRDANAGHGKIYIEVPCFEWICSRRACFDIFYEHVNYFCTSDFFRLFDTVYEAGHLFGGQYMYAVADVKSLKQPVFDEEPFAFPEHFLDSIFQHIPRIQTQPSAIWGGASKGVLFALLLQREGVRFECAIDINPAKQNKYLPCSGLPVISPEEALNRLPQGTNIYVMNSNYLDEIRKASNNKFQYITVDHGSF